MSIKNNRIDQILDSGINNYWINENHTDELKFSYKLNLYIKLVSNNTPILSINLIIENNVYKVNADGLIYSCYSGAYYIMIKKNT